METTSPKHSRWIVLLLTAVVISRLPLLFGGYGADPDAWRVAHVAKKFWDTGLYEVSRFPGYPLHEVLSTLPIALGGSLASNLLTLTCSLAAIITFWQLATSHTNHPKLLTIAFGFAPLFWVNSATTMDYAWSLLFILLSYREALKGRSLRSGLAFGVALGFRPSNVLVALAVAMILFLRTRRGHDIAKFLVSSTFAGVVSFLPVLLSYGVTGWLTYTHQQVATVNESPSMHALLFAYRAVYAWGPLAVIVALTILARESRKIRERLKTHDPIVISSLCGAGALLALFFSLPLEKGYLLPLLPFILLVMDAVASRNALIITILCLVSFGFVNPDVIQHEGVRGTPGFNLRPGTVIEEYMRKEALLKRREFLSTYPFPENTVVMTGVGPVFWVENSSVKPLPGQVVDDIRDITVRSLTQRNVLFTPMLNKADLDSLRSEGFNVVCVSDLRKHIEKSAGYSMDHEGISLVDVPSF